MSTTDPLSNSTTYAYGPGGTSETATYPTSQGATNVSAAYTDMLGRANNSQTQDGTAYDTESIYRYWESGVGFYTITPLACSTGQNTLCPTSGKVGQQLITEPAVTTIYDPLGRPITSTGAYCIGANCQTFSSTSYGYHASTNSSTNNVLDVLVSTNGASKNFEYDALGHLVSVCELSSQSGSGPCGQGYVVSGFLTTYTEDVLGRITNVSQGAQNRSYSYDFVGRLTGESNAESGSVSYTYDSTTGSCPGNYPGQLVGKVDANQNLTCYTYDLLGRVTSITYTGPNAGPSKYFIYDSATYQGTTMANAIGNLAEAYTCTTCPGTKITDEFFSYDKRGSLTDTWERTPNSFNYYHTAVGYFPNYAVNSVGGPGGTHVGYSLDSKGRPYTATVNNGAVVLVNSTSYNPADQPLSVNIGLGDSDVFSYDSGYRLNTFTYNVGAAGTNEAGVINYNSGNNTLASLQITDGFNTGNNQTCTYGYDDMLRLNSDSCNSVWSQTFSYDRYGNVTKSGSISFMPGYSPSSNHYTSVQGATYDSNGNLTNDGTNAYGYDAENFVVTLMSSSGTATITRDALGRIVEVDQPSGVYREMVYNAIGKGAVMAGPFTVEDDFATLPGGGELEALDGGSGGYLFHHKDWLGTSRLISNISTQSMYFDSVYAPFGENYSPSGTTDLEFTKQRQDVIPGIYDFQYREYNPNQGRWVSPDPAGRSAVDPSNPQTWNRYAYVANNALTSMDSLGLDPPVSSDGYRIEGIDVPSYIFNAFFGGSVSGNVIYCKPWCSLISSGQATLVSYNVNNLTGDVSGVIGYFDPSSKPNEIPDVFDIGTQNEVGFELSIPQSALAAASNDGIWDDVKNWFRKARLVGIGGSLWIAHPAFPVGWSPGVNFVSDGKQIHGCASILAGGVGVKAPGGSVALLFGDKSKAAAIITGWSVTVNVNTPFAGLGGQLITSSAGTLAGPSVGTPGVSVQVGYGGPCAP
jgi:RHS repeat-associated protein